jgi:hypothetical protein
MSGRGIAQAVSRWLPTAADRVRDRVWSTGNCDWQSGDEAGFIRVLRFPLPIFIPPNSSFSQSPGAGTIGQKWPTCRVGPVWTPTPTMRIKKKIAYVCDKSENLIFHHRIYQLSQLWVLSAQRQNRNITLFKNCAFATPNMQTFCNV